MSEPVKKYASGGVVSGNGADILIRISPCETLLHSDGRITRNGVTIGHWPVEKARETLAKLNGAR